MNSEAQYPLPQYNMAIPGTTPITAPVAPTAAGDNYPATLVEHQYGGWREVADNTARDAIKSNLRSEGMVVRVISTGLEWVLDGDLVTWNAYNPGGIDPSDIMLKSEYDPNDDSIVTNSAQLNSQLPAFYLSRTNHTGAQAIATVTGLQAALDAKEDEANKGAANGYVPLNASTKIDNSYLNFSLPLNPVIAWDVVTNTPTISDAGGAAGEIYIVYNSANPTVRDLGSGNISWNDGDAAIFDDGTSAFVKVGGFTNGVSQVTTALGVQTGAVTIDDLSYFNDATDRNTITDDQLAAIPVGADATDQLVLQSDLVAAIAVGNTFFTPDIFADGQTLGDGTYRTLTSLGYDNAEAAALWPRVDAAYTIDVTTQDIDWITHQEAMLTMQETEQSAFVSPGGRGYCPYDTILLPREQDSWTARCRSLQFKFDFNSSRYNNVTGSSFPMFKRYPVNQTEATSNFLSFRYFLANAYFEGNDTDEETDCFIMLGATVGSVIENIEAQACGMAIDLQFCMQSQLNNVNVVSFGKYGVAIRDGLWTGAGANTAQCNNAGVNSFRSVCGSGKTPLASIYVQGNRNTDIYKGTFEGFSGAETQILYIQAYPPSGTLPGTVKNTLRMTQLDFEGAGASRAAIRSLGNNIYSQLDTYNSQLDPGDTAVLFEACAQNGINGGQTVRIANAPLYNPGYKFRNVQTGGPTHKWIVENVELNNNASLINAANWDTSFSGTIPSTYRYTAVL